MADSLTPAAPSFLAYLQTTIHSHPLLTVSAGLLVAYTNFTRRGNFQWKAFVSLIAILLAGFVGIVSSLVVSPFGRRGIINWIVARFFSITLGSFTGIHFKVVEGQKYLEENPVIFVSNHQSSMDVLMLGALFPKNCAIVAKAEMKWYPLLGQFMIMAQTFFLDRKDRAGSINIFRNAAVQVKKKKISAWIFPEGTRSHSTEVDLLPFKKGAFHLAAQAGVPIVPVVVANYSHVYDSKHFVFRGGVVPIKVLPPIPTEGQDIDELVTKTRDAMLKALKEITPEETKKDH